MYETIDMGDIAFLDSLDHRITSTQPRGDCVAFEFALDSTEAERLLKTPERAICARYQRSLRRVRAMIDRALYGGG